MKDEEIAAWLDREWALALDGDAVQNDSNFRTAGASGWTGLAASGWFIGVRRLRALGRLVQGRQGPMPANAE